MIQQQHLRIHLERVSSLLSTWLRTPLRVVAKQTGQTKLALVVRGKEGVDHGKTPRNAGTEEWISGNRSPAEDRRRGSELK